MFIPAEGRERRKTRCQRRWKICEEAVAHNIMEEKRNDDAYGQVEKKDAGYRVTDLSDDSHAQEIFKIRRQAAGHQPRR